MAFSQFTEIRLHYRANWAWGKSLIIRLKDIGNIIRSMNPLTMLVRTHVPELERQILELAYGSTSAVQMDRDFIMRFSPANVLATHRYEKPTIIGIGSENDCVVRYASALWNARFTGQREIWLDLSHSDFTDDKRSSGTARRIAAALSATKEDGCACKNKAFTVASFNKFILMDNKPKISELCWSEIQFSTTPLVARVLKIPVR